jgi:large subunit ribosomal protein L30
MANTLKITLTKSPIGATPAQKKIVAALGLRKMQDTVELIDSQVTWGSVKKIRHLVTVVEQ